MRFLNGCAKSVHLVEAFEAQGWDAWTCDILPSEGWHKHIQDDVLKHLNDGWDLMIAHPPCTYLSYVGMRHWNKPGRAELREKAMAFFMEFMNAPIEKICVENPLGFAEKAYRKRDQIIQPYYFGDRYLKRTCLYLKGLPKLYWQPCDDMFGQKSATDYPEPMAYLKTTGKAIHWTEYMHGSEVRSRNFRGIAKAMAEQWGNLEGLEG